MVRVVTETENAAAAAAAVAPAAVAAVCFRMVGLPNSTTGADLLSASGKKSMLKQGAAWKMGPPRSLDVSHVDGGNMKLQMQVNLGMQGVGQADALQ
jgi:hypothetical protein